MLRNRFYVLRFRNPVNVFFLKFFLVRKFKIVFEYLVSIRPWKHGFIFAGVWNCGSWHWNMDCFGQTFIYSIY